MLRKETWKKVETKSFYAQERGKIIPCVVMAFFLLQHHDHHLEYNLGYNKITLVYWHSSMHYCKSIMSGDLDLLTPREALISDQRRWAIDNFSSKVPSNQEISAKNDLPPHPKNSAQGLVVHTLHKQARSGRIAEHCRCNLVAHPVSMQFWCLILYSFNLSGSFFILSSLVAHSVLLQFWWLTLYCCNFGGSTVRFIKA